MQKEGPDLCDFSVNLQMILVLFSGCAGSSLLHGLSLAVQMGAALAAVPGLLVAGHGIGGNAGFSSCSCWAQGTGSAVVAPGVSCPEACGILSDQGSSACLLHWHVGSLLLSHERSPSE